MQPVPEGPAPVVQSAPPLDASAPAMGIGGVPSADIQPAPSPMPLPDVTPAGVLSTNEGTNFVVPPTFGIDKGVPPAPAPEIPGLSAMPTERTDTTAVVAPAPSASPDIPGMTSSPVTSAPLSLDTSMASQLSDVQNTGGISPSAEAVSSTPPTIDWKPPASVTAGVDQAPQTTVSPVPPVEATVVAPVIPTAPPEVTPPAVSTEGADAVGTTAWKPEAPVVTNTENTTPSNVSVSTTTDAAPSGTDNAIGTSGWKVEDNNPENVPTIDMSSAKSEVSPGNGVDHTKNLITRMMDEKKKQAEQLAREQKEGEEVLALHESPQGKLYRETLLEAGWLDSVAAQQLKDEVAALRGNNQAQPTPLPTSEPFKQAA